MIRQLCFVAPIVLLSFLLVDPISAQNWNSNTGYAGTGWNYYGSCNTPADPRLGYCLTNDCFCNQGSGGPAGCGPAGSGSPMVIVRVRINGEGEPTVITIPPANCQGCYGQTNPSATYQRYVTNRPSPSRSNQVLANPVRPAAAPNGSRVRSASYRYKF